MFRVSARATFLVAFCTAQTLFAQHSGLAVKAHLDLTAGSDGFAGSLELFEDDRITPALDKTLWQSGGPDMALDESDPLSKQLAAVPLKAAVLRLRDTKGKLIAEMKLEREQARLETRRLHHGHRSVLVTTDLSAGFGSYSGPFTQILDLSRGSLEVVQARDVRTRSLAPIRLASTLKTAWQTDPSSTGETKDIFQAACRPKAFGPDSNEFLITYTRYHWDGSEWLAADRKLPGIWEADERFPPMSKFPSISAR